MFVKNGENVQNKMFLRRSNGVIDQQNSMLKFIEISKFDEKRKLPHLKIFKFSQNSHTVCVKKWRKIWKFPKRAFHLQVMAIGVFSMLLKIH